MRNFENIKPLHLEPSGILVIPKFQTANGTTADMRLQKLPPGAENIDFKKGTYILNGKVYNIATNEEITDKNLEDLEDFASENKKVFGNYKNGMANLLQAPSINPSDEISQSLYENSEALQLENFRNTLNSVNTPKKISKLELPVPASTEEMATALKKLLSNPYFTEQKIEDTDNIKVDGDTYQERAALREAKRDLRSKAIKENEENSEEKVSFKDKFEVGMSNIGSNIAQGVDFMRQSPEQRNEIRAENREERKEAFKGKMQNLKGSGAGWGAKAEANIAYGAAQGLSYLGTGLDKAKELIDKGVTAVANSQITKTADQLVKAVDIGPTTNREDDLIANKTMPIVADALKSSQNPYAMIAGYGLDALKTAGNYMARNHTPKELQLDAETKASMAGGYLGLLANTEKLSKGPGLANFLKGFSSYDNDVANAKAKLELARLVTSNSADRQAASSWEGQSLANEMSLNGGYKSAHVARNGIKLNLDFANKVVRKADSGLKFLGFDSVSPDDKHKLGEITMSNIPDLSDIVPGANDEDDTNYEDIINSYISSGFMTINPKGDTHDIAVNNASIYSSILSNASMINYLKTKYPNMSVRYVEKSTPHGNELAEPITVSPETLLAIASMQAFASTPFSLKEGGTLLQQEIFTFMPSTDEEVQFFKEGGSFNVIPDGALHKNKHNMEDAEGLTKKGIPVVTEEDGKKVLQAEIEVNEIIFRLEVTELLEKLAKEGTDEAAIEAGKLITKEILHNTHDNTGLIKETI